MSSPLAKRSMKSLVTAFISDNRSADMQVTQSLQQRKRIT